MINHQHLAVLQALYKRSPRVQSDLSRAAHIDPGRIVEISQDLAELGLITIAPALKSNSKWHALTAAGLAALQATQAAEQTTAAAAAREAIASAYSVALPRTHANLHQTYQPTQWPMRQGAEQHRSCPSRGFV